MGMGSYKPGKGKGARAMFRIAASRPCLTKDGRSTDFDGDEDHQGGSMPVMSARPASAPAGKAGGKGGGGFF